MRIDEHGLVQATARHRLSDIIHRVPNFDTPLTPAGQAKRVLFALGMQIPGPRAIDFAVRVRTPPEASSDTSTDARIRRAMAAIEDGPVAFVAENPELRDEPLSEPATTVAEAAEAVVYTLGQRLIDAPEPPDGAFTAKKSACG